MQLFVKQCLHKRRVAVLAHTQAEHTQLWGTDGSQPSTAAGSST